MLTDVGGDVPYLLQQVQNKGLKLTAIWLTHGHLDHAGGVVELLKNLRRTRSRPAQRRRIPAPSPSANNGAIRFPRFPVITPTRWLEEGETLKVGNHSFQVLHIPGHTPGQVVFLQRRK